MKKRLRKKIEKARKFQMDAEALGYIVDLDKSTGELTWKWQEKIEIEKELGLVYPEFAVRASELEKEDKL